MGGYIDKLHDGSDTVTRDFCQTAQGLAGYFPGHHGGYPYASGAYPPQDYPPHAYPPPAYPPQDNPPAGYPPSGYPPPLGYPLSGYPGPHHGHGPGMEAMLTGGAAAAYGAHHLAHGGYHGHKFKHHGKFKHGKFGQHGMFGGKHRMFGG